MVALVDFVAFGACMSMFFMHLNPNAAVQEIHKTPKMFAVLLANGWLWAMYGLVQDSAFPIFSSYFVALVYDTIYFDQLSHRDSKKRKILGCAGAVLLLVAIYVSAGSYGLIEGMRYLLRQILGYAATLSSLALLWSPFQTIAKAVKDRSNARIPIVAVSKSAVNSILWLVFSRMSGDWFLSVMSSGSLAFELIEVVCYVVFRSRHHQYIPIV